MTIHTLAGIVIIVSWVVFLLYWLISSFSAKRSVSRRAALRSPSIALRVILYLFVAILIYENVTSAAPAGAYEAYFAAHPVFELLGTVLTVIGIAFAIWARVYLGRNWGMPMTLRAEPELITSGPYRYVRHPIYTGALLALLGSTVVSGTWWALIFISSGAYFIVSALQEERDLVEKFPDTYPAYKTRTKMLIPFVL